MRTEAVVTRFEADDASKRADLQELPDGLKIAVVAAVLIDGEQAIGVLRKLHERNSLFESCCERFIDDHVAACLKALPREGIVRLVRSGNHDEAYLRNRK